MTGSAYRAALRFGMTKQQYMHLTPRDVEMFLDEKMKQEKDAADHINYTAWLNGLYVLRAVAAVMSKKSKYPKQPLTGDDSISMPDVIVATDEMSDEDKEATRQIFLGNLLEMQNNFNRTHKSMADTG